jgi:hypothetical protein
MPAVFIAQTTLQQWADLGKVRLDDTTLYLLKEKRSVLLQTAVRFTKLTVGDEDPHGLLGKVKTAEQLREMGAEHYMDSVIHGDTAYEVVEGFMGDLQAAKPTEIPPAPTAPAEPATEAAGSSPPPATHAAPAPASVPAPVPEAAPAADAADTIVDQDEEPEELSDAEALSKLFLDTVR